MSTNTALGDLRTPFRKLHQHSRIKSLRITTQRGSRNNFLFPVSSHPPGCHCSAPGRNTQHKRDALIRKGSAGWVTSFPCFAGHSWKGLLGLRPTQSPANLRWVGVAANKKSRGLPVSATQWEWPQFPVTCYTEKNNSQHSHQKAPANVTSLSLTGIHIADTTRSFPRLSPNSCLSQRSKLAASSANQTSGTAWAQYASLDPRGWPHCMHTAGARPPVVHLQAASLNSVTSFYCHIQLWWHPAAMEVM